jgi:TPR repeat protein
MGVASAMNKLGVMYANGSGVGKDMTEAVRWYRAAAAAGNADAKATLTSLGN